MKKMYLLILSGALMLLAAAVVAAQNPPTQRAVFKVENLTCGACFSKINQALGPLDGFSGMGANLLRNRVAVDFAAPLTPEKIGSAITRLGYPAALDTVDMIGEKETFAHMQSRRKATGYDNGCCGGGAAPAAAQCPGGGQAGSGLPQAGAPTPKTKDI
ncbi:MAG: heavy-metal-associated domain-containing protein [Desulfobacter sp.]|nr:heavy-metal-associated domain-containing protein [Desulfobacter sp.]WDP86906.1 MAG: heavy-metal-associated domain-containing protein [Desulfobacter sp.]